MILARVVAALALVAAANPHATIVARVVKVVDGDTIHARSGGEFLKVRLIAIDTPERDQPYASQARDALASLVSGREVRLETEGVDDYGRLLARVFVEEIDVNAELVRRGAAWVFRRYSDDAKLLALEREAHAQRRGLWALPESARVPPWEWRHPDTAVERKAAPSTDTFRCGEKKYCREMKSCAEARFHLDRCGVTGLDGDRDGEPCAALCAR